MPTPLELNWSDETTITAAGFTQDTGGINVGVSYFAEASATSFTGATTAQYVDTAGGETFATNSSLQLGGDGNDGTAGDEQTSTTTIDFSAVSGSGFSDEVENVSFRINDFDTSSWIDIVTVRAYDANGDQINVNLTWNGSSYSGTDVTLTSNVANGSASTETGSILVEIAGPVSYFEIDYDNDGAGGQALWVTDIHFDAISLDGTVEGSAGDDVIDGSYILDPEGDKIDNGDEILAGYGVDGDLIEAYGGNDTVLAGAGDDTAFGGSGEDSIDGGAGDDVLYGEADNDTITGGTGNDTLFGGTGSDEFQITDDHDSDTIFGGEDSDGSDVDTIVFADDASPLGVTVTATGDEQGTYDFDGTSGTGSYEEIEGFVSQEGDDTFNLGADNSGVLVDSWSGDDSITTGSGDDTILAGQGADTLNGGQGNDTMDGAGGDDVFVMEDGFGNDTITGGETGETVGDTLDASAVTTNLTVDLETLQSGNPEMGTISSGGDTATFSEIEEIILGSGDDTVTGSSGADNIDLGSGADTIEGGAGDDVIDLGSDGAGSPDGDADVVILEDGFGNDTVSNFDAPTPNGDGTFTGIDTVDVTGLNDVNGDPVNTNDVTVSDDGSGNAVLTFPNGESITLDGIDPADADDPFYLNAIGIPLPDGTVSGTAGNDVIDGAYIGDPDGDIVDNNDAILPGDVGDDDLIHAGAGDDSVIAGAGDDAVDGSEGNDTIDAGVGADIVVGGDGDDTITGGADDDLLVGDVSGANAVYYNNAGGELLQYNPLTGVTETVTTGLQTYGDIAMTPDGNLYGVLWATGAATDQGIYQIDPVTGTETLVFDLPDTGGNIASLTSSPSGDLYLTNDSTGVVTIIPSDGAGGFGPSFTGGTIGAATKDLLFLDENTVWTTSGGEIIEYEVDASGALINPTNLGTVSGNTDIFGLHLGDDGTVYATEGSGEVYSTDPNAAVLTWTQEPDADVSGGNIYGATSLNEDIAAVGNDSIDGGSGDDTIYGGAEQDTLIGGAGSDTVFGGSGDDTLEGGADNDTILGESGDDTIVLNDGFADDALPNDEIIEGGETGETNGDTLDGSGLTEDVTVTMTGDEAGTVNNGTGTATFSEIEEIILGSGDDTVTGSSGADSIDLGSGADTIEGGAGDDVIDLGSDGAGSPDGDADVVILEDGFGNDTVSNFDAPTPNGDGTFTGIDTVDVTGLNDVNGDPVNTNDVTVSDDGSGNAVLTFPNGESITLDGIDPADADDPFYLNAIGIPLPDGTVSGTAGDDTINNSYAGDPDGDFVDNNDAILPGDSGNDDLIEAGAGNDNVFAGLGNDEVYAGTGEDTVIAGSGDDTVFGEAGDDLIFGGTDADTIYGGEDDDIINGGVDADSLFGGDGQDRFVQEAGFGSDVIEGGEGGVDNDEIWSTQDVDITVTTTGDEAGSITDGTSTATFSEIEAIETEGGNDSIDLGADTAGMTVDSGAGDDIITGGQGDDVLDGGADEDTFVAEDNFGNDTVIGGQTGNNYDTLDLSGVTNPVTVAFTGPGAGTVTDTVTGDVITFSEIEQLILTDQADVVDATGDNGYTYIQTLEGNDSVLGSDGDDVFDEEIGVGTANDGAGNDTFFGGAGNDEIWAGNDDDTLFGGTGADTLQGQEDNDTVYGGSGADTVDGGSGDDTLEGGADNDTILGESGDDTIVLNDGFADDALPNDEIIEGGETGETNGDTLDGSGLTEDVTVTMTGDEAGTVNNGTGTATFSEIEEIETGSGDDVFVGGAGADSITTNAGDDTLTVSDGDTADAGSGDDVITLADTAGGPGATITVTGGAGDETVGDTLNVNGLVSVQDVLDNAVDDGTGSYSGSVTLDDGTILNFSEIENIICFTPETRIATPRGLVAIKDLNVGDHVVTRDHGLQPIRWIEARTVPAVDRFAPIRISKNVLAGQDRDLIVSPQHRVLFQGYQAEILFGESEVLVSAKHLVDGMDVTQDEGGMVTYVHMLFDQHEIIYAEGAATESFHPGDIGFTAVADEAREELFALFPELRVDPRAYGNTARRCLKEHEARLVRD